MFITGDGYLLITPYREKKYLVFLPFREENEKKLDNSNEFDCFIYLIINKFLMNKTGKSRYQSGHRPSWICKINSFNLNLDPKMLPLRLSVDIKRGIYPPPPRSQLLGVRRAEFFHSGSNISKCKKNNFT